METRKKLTKGLLLLIVGFMPLGQLPGILAQTYLGLPFRVHPLDILAVMVALLAVASKSFRMRPKGMVPFVVIVGFGVAQAYFSLPFFDTQGLLYLVRLVAYMAVFVVASDYVGRSAQKKEVVLTSLLLVGGVLAFFGWVQYLLLPDLRDLVHAGWDDHYFRLTSTLLDPAFTAIIFVLSAVIAFVKYKANKSRALLLLLFFMIVSLGFTYSRAGFLALFVAAFVLFARARTKLALALPTLLLIVIFLLPRGMGGEGVTLTRTASIVQKSENYALGMQVAQLSPVFGVGLNNICAAKEYLGVDASKQANSCYGLDNSFLFVLATAGFVGLFSLLYLGHRLFLAVASDDYGLVWESSIAALLAHSMFTNTLFYPWVLVWLAFLAATSRAPTGRRSK